MIDASRMMIVAAPVIARGSAPVNPASRCLPAAPSALLPAGYRVDRSCTNLPGAMPTDPPRPEPQGGAAPVEGLATVGLTDGEDPVSVTDVHGTVARFEMTYSAPTNQDLRFGPPWRQRLASLVFLAFGAAMVATVLYGESGASAPSLSRWLAEQDRGRAIGSLGLSVIVLVCAVGTVIRAQMRGLIVRPDGVEARYLLAMGLPRIRRWAWPQVERIIVDDRSVMFELWNGEYERLPEVRDHKGLRDALERVAGTRKIRLTRLSRAPGKPRRREAR